MDEKREKMRYTIKNEKLTAEIESLGAELKSLKSNRTQSEYMWYGDPAYYKRTSPILFPIVGSLKNQEYSYEGKTYKLPQHGFARDMEFSVTEQKEDEIWFLLVSNDETYAKYPFAFELHIGYRLIESTIRVMWKVVNKDTKEMYFSIGAHSEFNCPLNGEKDKSAYGLDFYTKENILASHINSDGLMRKGKEEVALVDGKMTFPDGFFDDSAYIVENNQTQKVSLLNPQKKPYVTIEFDAPLFGVWSPEKKNAPFVAIEPWYGRCDSEDFNGSLSEREWGNQLSAGATFEKQYEITITEK